MEYSTARTPASSTHSGDGGSEPKNAEPPCAEYRCDCGLPPAIRTSFTVQNMGMRFRCCSKKEGPCPYFHFMLGQQRFHGHVLELMLILKEKESKAIKEKEKLLQKNVDLLWEKERIAHENNRLMQGNLNVMQEIVQLKDEGAIMRRKVSTLEKKLKMVEKKCARAKMIIESVVLFLIISILASLVTVIISNLHA